MQKEGKQGKECEIIMTSEFGSCHLSNFLTFPTSYVPLQNQKRIRRRAKHCKLNVERIELLVVCI